MGILCITLEINRGYTTMHSRPIIKIQFIVNIKSQHAENMPVLSQGTILI